MRTELVRLFLCCPRLVHAARRAFFENVEDACHQVNVAVQHGGTALGYRAEGDELCQELIVAVVLEVGLGLDPEVLERHDLVGGAGERDDFRGQDGSFHCRVSLTLGCDRDKVRLGAFNFFMPIV